MYIDPEGEQNTEAYQEILNIVIENMDKIKNIHRHHKTHWRKIYKIIQQELFDYTQIFPEEVLAVQ